MSAWVKQAHDLIGKSATPLVNQHNDFDRWLEEHGKVLGASESAGLLVQTPWSSPLTVFARKTGLTEVQDNERMKWGRLLEASVAEGYLSYDESGRNGVICGDLMVSKAWPWLGATPDYLLAPCDDYEGPGLLEIKTANARAKESWLESPNLVPDYYYVQVQQQLAVTGLKWASIACLFGGQELLWTDVPRDEELIANLVATSEHFWKEHYLKGVPPDPVGTDGDEEALAKLHPKPLADAIQLGEEASRIDDRLQMVGAMLKDLQAEERALKQSLKAMIGPHEVAVLPEGVTYTFKETTRKGYVVEDKTFRQLRRKRSN